MVDGAEHLTSCHLLAFLSAFSYIQLMQNSAPSTICWCQCDIQIDLGHSNAWNIRRLVNVLFAPATQCITLKIVRFLHVALLLLFWLCNIVQTLRVTTAGVKTNINNLTLHYTVCTAL